MRESKMTRPLSEFELTALRFIAKGADHGGPRSASVGFHLIDNAKVKSDKKHFTPQGAALLAGKALRVLALRQLVDRVYTSEYSYGWFATKAGLDASRALPVYPAPIARQRTPPCNASLPYPPSRKPSLARP